MSIITNNSNNYFYDTDTGEVYYYDINTGEIDNNDISKYPKINITMNDWWFPTKQSLNEIRKEKLNKLNSINS